MSYQVLARKWRPRLFSELVGQQHVVRALTNALDKDRLHHAYLFTGTRGVGKTTLARIFAKSLNCEQGVSSTPCGQCSACQELDEGRFVDLLEVDAASRTKVDQTRELLENVPYAPVRGRYKVYLIDEVHMFSGSSFNALLKTLEEPPPHVKFLLATTDPQKVPVTVLSRCLQFNLKRLLLDEILDRLQEVLQQEEISFEQPALLHLARAADGSMRDGLSLMDQAIAFGGGEVKEADVRAMLGTVDKDQVHSVLRALADQDAQQVMAVVASMAERVPDFAGVLQELLALLHRIALLQVVPGAVDESAGDQVELSRLAEVMPPEDVQLYYQIGLIGQRDLPQAPDLRSGFEMVLLRMLAFRPDRVDMAAPTTTSSRPAKAVSREDHKKPASRESEGSVVTTPPQAQAEKTAVAEISDWYNVVAQLNLGGIAQQLAHNCRYDSWDGKRLRLLLDPAHQQLKVESTQQRLQKALEGYLNCSLKLDIEVGQQGLHTPAAEDALLRSDRQQEAESKIAADPMVQAIGKKFGSRPVPGSIKPIDD